MKKTILSLSTLLVILFSCTKESLVSNELKEENGITEDGQKLIDDIQSELLKLNDVDFTSRLDLTPYNENNFMEETGLAIKNTIISSNKINLTIRDDFNVDIYENKFINEASSLMPKWKFTNLTRLNNDFTPLELALRNAYFTSVHNDLMYPNRLINKSRVFENLISKSKAIDIDGKSIILTLISQYKYMNLTIHDKGFFINGIDLSDGDNLQAHPFCDFVENCVWGRIDGKGYIETTLCFADGMVAVYAVDCAIKYFE